MSLGQLACVILFTRSSLRWLLQDCRRFCLWSSLPIRLVLSWGDKFLTPSSLCMRRSIHWWLIKGLASCLNWIWLKPMTELIGPSCLEFLGLLAFQRLLFSWLRASFLQWLFMCLWMVPLLISSKFLEGCDRGILFLPFFLSLKLSLGALNGLRPSSLSCGH